MQMPNGKKKNEIEGMCSFCGKSQKELRFLIAGPGVYICDECVELCIDILYDKDPELLLPTFNFYINDKDKMDKELLKLNIKPRFRQVQFIIKEKHCFYLCPFADPFNNIYKDHVKPIIESMGYSVERADDIFGTQPIIEDIWEGINSAEFVIADVTNRNPNVMYEIGMAHTIGKPVIIITQNIEDVPFDLKHYRCIIYNYTPPGCKSLEEKIRGTLTFLARKK